jgi:hypothetical protein
MGLRKMNQDGEWVDDDSPEPRASNPSQRDPDPIRRGPGGSRLNAIGCIFILLGVAALVVGGVATLALDLQSRLEQRFFGLLLGGGMFGVVVLLAAVLRVLGVPFFRDDD